VTVSIQVVDCMTKRRLHDNTSSSHVSAIEDHVTSTGHNLKLDHFDILAKGLSESFCKGTLLMKEIKTYPE